MRPALLLLDLNLPDATGETVQAQVRADPELADIPVIVVSADAMPATTERLLANGASAFLAKPLDLQAFLQEVDALLEASSA